MTPIGIARSLTDYLNTVLDMNEQWRRSHPAAEPWFRGSTRASYQLLPGAYRANWDEDSLFTGFCTEASILMDPDLRPTSLWMWYFAAQHYGLPTRLLDWSEDPLVGLYFALRGDLKDTDGPDWVATDLPVVWMLEAASLTHAFYGEDFVYVPYDDNDGCENWLPGRCERGKPTPLPGSKISATNEFPIAIHPTRMTRRIQAQAGKFTAHGTSDEPIERLWARSARPNNLVCIALEEPDRVWRELTVLGYSRYRLFPEPATLADRLRRDYTP